MQAEEGVFSEMAGHVVDSVERAIEMGMRSHVTNIVEAALNIAYRKGRHEFQKTSGTDQKEQTEDGNKPDESSPRAGIRVSAIHLQF
jgi:hypothetical protein